MWRVEAGRELRRRLHSNATLPVSVFFRDHNVDVPPQRHEKHNEAFNGKAAQPSTQQRGHLRLVNLDDLPCLRLSEDGVGTGIGIDGCLRTAVVDQGRQESYK